LTFSTIITQRRRAELATRSRHADLDHLARRRHGQIIAALLAV
jgi:hypothetical protein